VRRSHAGWRAIAPHGHDRWKGELFEHSPFGAHGIAARPLYVYLPPSYSPRRKLPLLLLHDGQNLFEEAKSYAGSWHVPRTIDRLDGEGLPLVVAAPANGGAKRIWEYAPFVDRKHGGGGAEHHLAFLMETVVPIVRSGFAVSSRREEQAIGGASLGGLASLWALFRAPGEFGRVLAMSPTTLLAGESLRAFVRRARPVEARIYLDCGLEEGRRKRRWKWPLPHFRPTAYVRRVRRLRRALEAKGFREPESLRYLEAEGGTHSEAAWGRRLPDALRYLWGEYGDR
jgi:enterochelin esterase-like enzyme